MSEYDDFEQVMGNASHGAIEVHVIRREQLPDLFQLAADGD
jgi:hypothetical protein